MKMSQGDMFWVDLDPIVGHEQAGHRPVMVISPGAFNDKVGVPIIVPITTQGQFVRRIGFAVELIGCKDIEGWARCDQPRSLDLIGRNAEFIECAPNDITAQVVSKVCSIFQ